MVNLELYRVFYTVAKCGSLTKAAESLYISQPAVSQSIKQLESQLGGKLFLRTPKGMTLTEEGRAILENVKNAIGLFIDAENKFSEVLGIAASTLKIGASDTLCKHFLLKYIERFHINYPQINLEVYNRTTPQIIGLIKNKMADIGFVNLPVTDDALNIIEPCMHLNDIFIYSSKFMPFTDEVLPLKKLENYPLLLLEHSSNTRKSLIDFTANLGIKLNAEIELGSIDLVIDFAKSGLGIGCVPKEYVLNELNSKELFEIKTLPALPVRGIGIVTLKNAEPSFIIKQLIDDIRKDIAI